MRKIVIPIIAMVILVVGFFVGSSSQMTAISISTFCLWTPASIWLGWSLAKSGVRLAVVTSTATTQPSRQTKRDEGDVVKRAMKKLNEDVA